MLAVTSYVIETGFGGDNGYFGMLFLYELDSFGGFFADDDVSGVFLFCAQEGAEAGGTGADNKDGVFPGYLGDADGPETGGEDVADEEGLFIAYGGGDGGETAIGMGNSDVFGLSAVDATPQRPAAVGICTVVDVAVLTEIAGSAKGFDVYGYAITGFYLVDLGSDLFYDAYHFVPYRDAGMGLWHAAVLDMQIAGADTAEGYADDGIAGGLQDGFRLFEQFEVSGTDIGVC